MTDNRSNDAREVIGKFLATYQAAVTSLDTAALASHWSLPCLMLIAGEPVLWQTVEGVRGAFEGLATRLRTRGFRRALSDVRDSEVVAPDMIAVSVHWALLDASDAPILTLENRYLLVKSASAWRAKVMTERLLEGDESTVDQPEDAPAVARQFIAEYRSVFRRLVPNEVARFWRAPTLALGNGVAQLCTNETEVVAAFEVSLGALRAQQTTDVVPELKRVRPLGPGMLEIAVDWDLVQASGNVFKRLVNVYLLRNTPDGWKVAAVYLA